MRAWQIKVKNERIRINSKDRGERRPIGEDECSTRNVIDNGVCKNRKAMMDDEME